MTSLNVNANNDIFMNDQNNISLVFDIDATLQQAQQAMQAQRGEMILSVDQGVPTNSTVWQKTNIPQFEAAARVEIESVDNVVRLVSIDTVINGDVLSYIAVIETTFGTGSING